MPVRHFALRMLADRSPEYTQQTSQLTKSIDNLGEEVAQDINSFEQMIKAESDKIMALN